MTDASKAETATTPTVKTSTKNVEPTDVQGAPPVAPTRRAPRKTSTPRASANANLDNIPFENRVLTIADVAKHLGISSYTVQDMLRKGDLPGTKVRSRWRITGAQVTQYMNENQQ